MEVSLLELWHAAGWFARGIIILLGLMSVFSLGVGAQKWWRFRRGMRETRKFAPEFARFLQEEQLDQAIAVAEKAKKSHVARVLGEALAEVKPLLRDRATITSADINSAERAIERQMNGGVTTIIEVMCTRELGDPFRRDALSKPVRYLDKYRDYV